MIPIRDALPSKNYPLVNQALIGLNVVVFLIQLSQGANLDRFVYIYGLVPARYSVPQLSHYFTVGQQLIAFVSFMFLHGGFWHLLGNMWSLYIFGDNVEDRLGSLRYLFFYLLCGLASGIAHLALNLESNVPTIGASGAIAGVMGAYLVLYPHSRILTLIPIIIIPWFIEIPAYFFIGLWFVLQLINAAVSHGGAAGIAWWAHIGGFVFGIFLLKMLLRLPSTGVTQKLRQLTTKRKSPRLQVIRPVGPGSDPDLYGTIVITPFEAQVGSRKLVNIPWGFHKRPFRVTVPPGMREGKLLRLRGLGKQLPDGRKGDLYLKVMVR
jgi:membrane associated rhomboid family serine protease